MSLLPAAFLGQELELTRYCSQSRLVRQKLHELDPLGVQRRWPGAHRPYRAVLQSAGWADEWAADGHEKLAERGLGLGPTVSFEIYGIRDKYTGAFVILKCVPNARDRATVGHVYLDAVESEGGEFSISFNLEAR